MRNHGKFFAIILIFCSIAACSREAPKAAIPSKILSNQTKAYEHCSQILANGIYEDRLYTQDYSAKSLLVSEACNTLTSYASEDDDRWSKNCDNSTSSSGGNLGLDVIIKAVPIGFDAGYQSNDSNSYCSSASSRLAYRRAWHQHMCASVAATSSLDVKTNQALKSVNSGIVDAWTSCIAQRYQGLTCIGTKAGDGINFEVNYDPAPPAPARIELQFEFTGIKNNSELPRAMGHGKIIKAFTFDDITKESNIIVSGIVADGGQTACSYQLPPQESRRCQNGNLVGITSGKTYETEVAACKQLDSCEAGRLTAVIRGKIGWNQYRIMKESNWSAYFSDNYMSIAECPL